MTYTVIDYMSNTTTHFPSLIEAQHALQRLAANYRRFGCRVHELVAAGYITVNNTLVTIICH